MDADATNSVRNFGCWSLHTQYADLIQAQVHDVAALSKNSDAQQPGGRHNANGIRTTESHLCCTTANEQQPSRISAKPRKLAKSTWTAKLRPRCTPSCAGDTERHTLHSDRMGACGQACSSVFKQYCQYNVCLEKYIQTLHVQDLSTADCILIINHLIAATHLP